MVSEVTSNLPRLSPRAEALPSAPDKAVSVNSWVSSWLIKLSGFIQDLLLFLCPAADLSVASLSEEKAHKAASPNPC